MLRAQGRRRILAATTQPIEDSLKHVAPRQSNQEIASATPDCFVLRIDILSAGREGRPSTFLTKV
jgi:hypothetical protein